MSIRYFGIFKSINKGSCSSRVPTVPRNHENQGFRFSKDKIEKLLIQNEAEKIYGAFQESFHYIYYTNGPKLAVISPIMFLAFFL